MVKYGANTLILTDDIEHLPNDVLDGLDCGDVVVKMTGVQKHLYFVTYKGEGADEGICMSYFACGYLETVSYDRNDDGTWTFNSKDVWQAE